MPVRTQQVPNITEKTGKKNIGGVSSQPGFPLTRCHKQKTGQCVILSIPVRFCDYVWCVYLTESVPKKMHMCVCVQHLQLFVCREVNEVCVVACCSATFISLQCLSEYLWVCLCVCLSAGVFSVLKHKFLGNSRSLAKCLRFGCQHCQSKITDSNTEGEHSITLYSSGTVSWCNFVFLL